MMETTTKGRRIATCFLNSNQQPGGTSSSSSAEFGDDVSKAADNSWDDDPIAKSFTGLDSLYQELAKELQRFKHVGKDDSKMESMLASGEANNTDLEDLFKKKIQAEVEYVVISTATEDLLHEIKLNLRQNKAVVINNIDASRKEAERSKLETREGVKKLRNRVCKFTSCVLIQLILLLLTLYLQFSTPNLEVVPT